MKTTVVIFLLLTSSSIFGQTASDFFLKAEKFGKKNKYDLAIENMFKAIELDSLNTTYYNYRGRLFNHVGAFESAIIDFTTEYNLTPDSLKIFPLINIAAAKQNKGDFQGAYSDLIEAYYIDTLNLIVLNNLATLCDEVGKGNEALKYLLKAQSIDSTDFVIYGNIGYKYQSMGQYEEAMKYFNKEQELKPNEPVGLCNISYNKYLVGDIKGAEEYIERSLNIYPGNSYAYKVRALIYLKQGSSEKACFDLQKAIELGYRTMYGEEVDELIKNYCNNK